SKRNARRSGAGLPVSAHVMVSVTGTGARSSAGLRYIRLITARRAVPHSVSWNVRTELVTTVRNGVDRPHGVSDSESSSNPTVRPSPEIAPSGTHRSSGGVSIAAGCGVRTGAVQPPPLAPTMARSDDRSIVAISPPNTKTPANGGALIRLVRLGARRAGRWLRSGAPPCCHTAATAAP